MNSNFENQVRLKGNVCSVAIRSVVSLALYSGRYLDVGVGLGGGGGQLYPGRDYYRTRKKKKKRFKTIDMAVLIKTRLEFTGF